MYKPKIKRWAAYCRVNGRTRQYVLEGVNSTIARRSFRKQLKLDGDNLESSIILVKLT